MASDSDCESNTEQDSNLLPSGQNLTPSSSVNNSESDDSAKKRKKGNNTQKSIIWSHVRKIKEGNKEKLVCNHCTKSYVFFGSTTNMRSHLIEEHNIDEQYESEDVEDDDPRPSNRYKQLHIQLLRFIISGFLPFRIVENLQFKLFVKRLRSDYKLPSRKYLSSTLLNEVYLHDKIMVKNELENSKYVSLTLDLWSSEQQYSYVGVTCHFFDENFNYFNRLLTHEQVIGSHSSGNLTEVVRDILVDWGLTGKVFGLVTDHASNVLGLGDSLGYALTDIDAATPIKIHQLGCTAHLINLIVGKMCKPTSELLKEETPIALSTEEWEDFKRFQAIVVKCKKTAQAFHQSNILSEQLENKQEELGINQHKLIQEVPTRWNSTYLMMERIFEQVKAINAVFRERAHKNKYNHLLFGDEEIKDLEDIIEIMEDFYVVTCELSATKYPSSSLVIPLFSCLKENLKTQNTDSSLVIVIKKMLSYYMNFYLRKYSVLENPIFVTATFLDVRTKEFTRFDEKQKKAFIKLATESIKKFSSDGTIRQTQSTNDNTQPPTKKPRISIFDIPKESKNSKARAKLSGIDLEIFDYTSEVVTNTDPIEFWKKNSSKYPTLSNVFKKVFSIPASSVPSEQLFSHSGYTIWDRRTRLSPTKVAKIMFIYENTQQK